MQVHDHGRLSFHNSYGFLKKVDQLLTGPEWNCDRVTLAGDRIGEDSSIMMDKLEAVRSY